MQLNPIYPLNREVLLECGVKASFRYKVGFIRDGVRHFKTDWVDHLILDQGLNLMGTNQLADCWTWCLFGNAVSPTPVTRASGAITFTQVGTTITASGSFFISTDTGRLFKYGVGTGGAEVYLTFVNATTATASISMTVAAPTVATIWYVNETALDSFFISTSTYGTNGGDNSTSVSGNVVTYQRTYVSGAAPSATTLTEIAFGLQSNNVNIFDRDIITGGVSINSGDQPIAIAQIILTVNPNTSTAFGNVATGYDSSGTFIISGFGMTGNPSGLSYIASNGSSSTGGIRNLEGSQPGFGEFLTGAFSLPAFSNSNTGTALTGVGIATGAIGVTSSYSNGNFYRDRSFSYAITQGNGTITGFCYCDAGSVSPNSYFTYRFTTPFTKLNTQTLSITFRHSWQRILTN